MSVQQLETLGFGAGIVLASPVGGQLGTDPTPLEVGTVQNVKLSITADIKSLWGQNQFAVDSAIGKRGIKGSVGFAQISGQSLNNLLFGNGGSVEAGAAQTVSYRESHTIPATPFEVTIDPPDSGTFVANLGVIFAATGQPLAAVASGPTTGQYSIDVETGIYTFAAADTLLSILISYSYSLAADGQTFSVVNTAMGQGPILSLYLPSPYQSTSLAQLDRGIYLPNVRFGKLDLTTKLDDYEMFDTDFEAFVNPATNIIMQSFLPY